MDNKQRHSKKANKKLRGGDDINLEIYENLRKETKKQDYDDVKLIHKSFKCHSVFFSLSPHAIDSLTQKMFYCT